MDTNQKMQKTGGMGKSMELMQKPNLVPIARKLLTRNEYLNQSKKRAIDLCRSGMVLSAFDTLSADLSEHPDLANHPALSIGAMLYRTGAIRTEKAMEEFIRGFN